MILISHWNIISISGVAHRKTNLVRCFAWHPHAPKFAVALQNDCVTVNTVSPNSSCDVIIPTLKHKMQKGVADLAWK